MTQSEYEQKKEECLQEFCKLHDCETPHDYIAGTFNYAFDRAYALGKQEGAGTVSFKRSLTYEIGDKVHVIKSGKDGIVGEVSPRRGYYVFYGDGYGEWCKEADLNSYIDAQDVSEVKRNLSEQKPGEPKFSVGNWVRVISPDKLGCIGEIIEVEIDEDAIRYQISGVEGWHFLEKNLQPYTKPKFHKGEKVCYNGYVYEIEGLVDKNRYALKGLNFDLDEGMIEPYNEPNDDPLKSRISPEQKLSDSSDSSDSSDPCPYCNLSQETANCDKEFDNILKDSFSKERRLHVASMVLQGIMANPNERMIDMNINDTLNLTLRMTDALLNECEEGGSHD